MVDILWQRVNPSGESRPQQGNSQLIIHGRERIHQEKADRSEVIQLIIHGRERIHQENARPQRGNPQLIIS